MCTRTRPRVVLKLYPPLQNLHLKFCTIFLFLQHTCPHYLSRVGRLNDIWQLVGPTNYELPQSIILYILLTFPLF
jgi:hypothetical protein